MVKGPQGIGKSHSLVNLALTLMSNVSYHVTFIPDCGQWSNELFLFRIILASFGMAWESEEIPIRTEWLIKFISEHLAKHSIKWVFIYDQINRIFLREGFQNLKDIGSLSRPFSLIKHSMIAGRVTSIISVSADNEILYKNRYEGFVKYYHPVSMDLSEIWSLYPNHDFKDENILSKIQYLTGFVPFYLSRYLELTEDDYRHETCSGINSSYTSLRTSMMNQYCWEDFKVAMIRALLKMNLKCKTTYDRKFWYPAKDKDKLIPLFALVEEVFRDHLWDALTKYVQSRELELLRDYDELTPDAKRRVFESIVIRRMSSHPLTLVELRKLVPNYIQALVPQMTVSRFEGTSLPMLTPSVENVIFIPINMNFPAIDFAIRFGQVIIAFQVHTSDHDSVAQKFHN